MTNKQLIDELVLSRNIPNHVFSAGIVNDIVARLKVAGEMAEALRPFANKKLDVSFCVECDQDNDYRPAKQALSHWEELT